jgi:hypothetical protein
MLTAPFSSWALTELENFSEDFAKRWTFDCQFDEEDVATIRSRYSYRKYYKYPMPFPSQQYFIDFIEYEAKLSIKQGLTDLFYANPRLYKKAIKKRGKKLHFQCDMSIGLGFLNSSITAEYYNNRIYLGKRALLNLFGASVENRPSIELRNTLLHEFYHYVNFGNLNHEEHKMALHNLEYGDHIKDVVFACSSLSFPHHKAPVEKSEDKGFYSFSKKACMVCSNAQPKFWGGTQLPKTLSQNSYCDNVKDKEFITGYLGARGPNGYFEPVRFRKAAAWRSYLSAILDSGKYPDPAPRPSYWQSDR